MQRERSAFRVTGPFVAMIRFMLVRDLKQFSAIYLVFLYAFGQCFFYINLTKPTPSTSTSTPTAAAAADLLKADQATSGATLLAVLASLMAEYAQLCLELFKMTLGVYDLEPFRHSVVARLFFLLFMYLVPILFNM